MKISEQSWHYRLLNFCNYTPQRSLCLYFWQVVWSVLTTTVAVCIMTILAALFLYMMAMPVLAFLGVVTPGGYICVILWVVVLAGIFEDQIKNKYRDWQFREKKERKESEPNILSEWIKAKKNKVCPTIEFTRGDR